MALSLECPHCGRFSNFRQRWFDDNEPWGGDGSWSARGCYTCDYCDWPIAAIFDPNHRLKEYWPVGTGHKEYPDVPDTLGAVASEAHQCLTAGAPRGAVALARAVIESVAKEKGIAKGTLQSKIGQLYKEGYISEAMKEAAEEIRFAGNEVAHGDLVAEPIGQEDADEIVSLMDTILERIYQEPAQVERIRAKREARRNRPAEEEASTTTDEPPF